jgi:hypothetical protein
MLTVIGVAHLTEIAIAVLAPDRCVRRGTDGTAVLPFS